VNEGKHKTAIQILLVLVITQAALADSARVSTSQGNKFYKQGNFNEAINSYDQALLDAPGALEPKFNQANSYYRLDDLGKAMDLYRQVSAESKDMKVVGKAKYNLGNSYFQQGSKQKDSNLQKAINDLKTAIAGQDVTRIRDLIEQLQQATYALSQQLYQTQQQAQSGGPQPTAQDDDVVEGEFEEI